MEVADGQLSFILNSIRWRQYRSVICPDLLFVGQTQKVGHNG